ncbi:MAG: glycosyltransferase family 2 protein [Atopococcus tabaci]|uniref:Glycosyltransferase family 2 protein n=1 Tax=Atopococcus tabaci TaxID=269774 RepID=A0AA43UCY2_9LACT|nr:glycosyltransferase family 2 protein [Atopococcus tabaci]
MKLITIIIPCYNEEDVLPALYQQLNEVTQSIDNYKFEYLFVNDGSKDMTLDTLRVYKEQDARVRYIDLSRNFGKEIGMLAGMDYAAGDAVIVMDADLQHPPNKIIEMIDWWEKGYDDVYTVRLNREGSFLTKATSTLYYWLVQKMTEEKVYPNSGDFRLLDRKCVDALTSMREIERYTKGMYSWIGFKKKELTYTEEKRVAGETKWQLSQLVKLAVDGITSYSTVPLRISSIIGIVISLIAFVFLLIEIIKIFIQGPQVAGYGTLLVGILFMGGIQLISLGIIGEYLSRIFVETKDRPPYLINEISDEDD